METRGQVWRPLSLAAVQAWPTPGLPEPGFLNCEEGETTLLGGCLLLNQVDAKLSVPQVSAPAQLRGSAWCL